MQTRPFPVFRRRNVVAAGIAALGSSLLGARKAAARTVLQRGITGGGMARFERVSQPVLVHFSIFASAVQFPDGEAAFVGRLQWTEPGSGLVLESIAINDCAFSANNAGGRDVRGRINLNGAGNYPFTMQLIDNGPPGSGQDTLRLEVNSAAAREAEGEDPAEADDVYTVEAQLVAGDLQWLAFDTPVGS